MDIKKLVEEYEILEDKGMTKEEFTKEIKKLIDNDFAEFYTKLYDTVKTFKDANPNVTENSLDPTVFNKIAYLAETTGMLIDILNGKKDGLAKKLRKALGYNG